jgi:hypothetical protein
MQFSVKQTVKPRVQQVAPGARGLTFAGYTKVWSWELVQASGKVICRSAGTFDTEPEARSDIAAAKKSMKGAWRCKVVTVDDPA